MTYRLREAGLNVCLLERGKAYPPGSFPRSPYAFRRAFWDPSEGLYGMYNAWWFDHIGAVVSSALGGGSLIYANVMLRKDPAWFVHEDIETRWHRIVADQARRPRAALRPRRADAQRPAVPVHLPAVRHDAADGRLPRRGPPARLGAVHPEPRGHLPERGRRPGPGRAHPRGAPEPPRPDADDLPAVRRVRHRLQLRVEEHARLQLPVRGGAPRRRDPHPDRGARLRPARRRRLDGRPRPPRPVARGDEARHEPPADDPHQRRPARPVRGDARLDLPDVPQPAAPAADARHAVRRQRRPADPRPAARRSKVDGKTQRTLIDPGRGPVITSAIRFPDEADGGEGRGFYVQDIGFPEFVGWMLQATDAPGIRSRASATPPSACCARRSTRRPRRTCRPRSRTSSATPSRPASCRSPGWVATSRTAA